MIFSLENIPIGKDIPNDLVQSSWDTIYCTVVLLFQIVLMTLWWKKECSSNDNSNSNYLTLSAHSMPGTGSDI